MKGLDVLFVAAGGNFTPDARAISGQITPIAPRVAILMHYRTGLGGLPRWPLFPTWRRDSMVESSTNRQPR